MDCFTSNLGGFRIDADVLDFELNDAFFKIMNYMVLLIDCALNIAYEI